MSNVEFAVQSGFLVAQSEPIARGGQAAVYPIESAGEDKILWVPSGKEGGSKALVGWVLCRERLMPPHFPHVHRVSETHGAVMEFVRGRTPNTWNEQEADAVLSELKAANVFHRDIRLRHIIKRPTGHWCLIDFGWACDYDDQYPAPWYLGAEGRKARGVQDDAYAMDVIRKKLGG